VNHSENIEAKHVFFSAVHPKDKNIHFCETIMQPLLYIGNSRTNNSSDMRPLERHTCMFKFKGIFLYYYVFAQKLLLIIPV
jgi:hypothetical protein